jgi:hypothetical protein
VGLSTAALADKAPPDEIPAAVPVAEKMDRSKPLPPAWRVGLVAVLVTGGLVVAAFWAGFLIDYPLTRSLYFTVALVHVLAEVPFILREA